MKLTKKRLSEIIQEELSNFVSEKNVVEEAEEEEVVEEAEETAGGSVVPQSVIDKYLTKKDGTKRRYNMALNMARREISAGEGKKETKTESYDKKESD